MDKEKTLPNLRSFQEVIYDKWVENGNRGILKAVPGAGKTVAAMEVIRQYDPDRTKRILVVVPTVPLLNQWTFNMELHGYDQARITTVNKARETEDEVDLLVVDEIHRTMSEKNVNMYNLIKYDAILGMSATPKDECKAYAGKVIVEVDFKTAIAEGMISNFKVHFHMVDMTRKEIKEYDRLTKLLKNIYSYRATPPEGMTREKYAEVIALARRRIVYDMDNREPYTMGLLTDDVKTLIFCQSVEEAENFASMIPGSETYHYKTKTREGRKVLERFKSGETRVLVSVRALTEGFDVPDIGEVIVVSTATTDTYHVQTLGRAIRKYGDMISNVHVLIGKGTSDEKLLKHANDYPCAIIGEPSPEMTSKLKPYYEGRKYSLGTLGVFRTIKGRRVYFDVPDALPDMVRKVKPKGGKFSINGKGEVHIRDGGDSVKLGVVDIYRIKERPRKEPRSKGELTKLIFGDD